MRGDGVERDRLRELGRHSPEGPKTKAFEEDPRKGGDYKLFQGRAQKRGERQTIPLELKGERNKHRRLGIYLPGVYQEGKEQK